MLKSKTSEWNIRWVFKNNVRFLSKKKIIDCSEIIKRKIKTNEWKIRKIINKNFWKRNLEKGW